MFLRFLRYTSILVLAGGTSVCATSEPIKVFVMAGQSNMLGGSRVSGLPESLRGPQHDVLYSYLTPAIKDDVSDGFESLRPLERDEGNFTYGSEITFGRTVADSTDGSIAIIKVAYRGTGLANRWLPERDDLYVAMKSHVEEALSDLADMDYVPNLEAFVWVQSQADARRESFASSYQDNLNSLVSTFREDFGAQDLLFLQSQHHINSNAEFGGIVRQKKISYTNSDPNSRLIDIDDLALNDDEVHFSTQAHIELGNRLAAEYLSAVPEPSSAVVVFLICLPMMLFHAGRGRMRYELYR